MSENAYFSIIIPVFNASKTLKKAVASLLNQTYKNFEIIMVEDHSQDNSYQLCQNIASEDSRIKLYRTEKNSGAAVARNIGLEKMNGVYVTFCDSDDYVDDKLLETAYNSLIKNPVNCLKIGCIEEYTDDQGGIYNKVVVPENVVYTDKTMIKKAIVELELKPLFGYLWNGFYKQSLIKRQGLKINPAFRVNEDFDFNIRYFHFVDSFQTIGYAGYHYTKVTGSNSLSSVVNEKYYALHMMKIEKFLEFFGGFSNIDTETKQKIFWLYTRFIYSTLQRINSYGVSRKYILHEVYNSDLYKLYKQIVFDRVGIKQKILISLLQGKRTFLILEMIYLIDFVRKYLPFLFAKIKG